jgi:hypothetical protein
MMRSILIKRLVAVALLAIVLFASKPDLAAHRNKIGTAFAKEHPTLGKVGGKWLFPQTVRLKDRGIYTVGTIDGKPVSYGILGMVFVTGDVSF